MNPYIDVIKKLVQSHTRLSSEACDWLCSLISSLAKERESQYVDFKEAIPSECKLAHVMLSMDIEGGIIVLGVTDDGRIVGLQNRYAKREVVDDQVAKCVKEPSKLDYNVLECVCNGRKLLFVFVYPSSHEYIEAKDGKCYVRIGATKQPVSCEEVAKIKLEKWLSILRQSASLHELRRALNLLKGYLGLKPKLVNLEKRDEPWVSFESLSFEEAGLSILTHSKDFVSAPITMPIMIGADGIPTTFLNDYVFMAFSGYASGKDEILRLLEVIEDKLREEHIVIADSAWSVRHSIYYFVRPSGFPQRIQYTLGFTAKDLAKFLKAHCKECYFAYVTTVYGGTIYVIVGHYPIHATIHVVEHGIWSTEKYYVGMEGGMVKLIPVFFKLTRAPIVSGKIAGKILLKPLIVSYRDGLASVEAFRIVDTQLSNNLNHGCMRIVETMEPKTIVARTLLSREEAENVENMLLEVNNIAFTGKTIGGLLLGDTAVHLTYVTLYNMRRHGQEKSLSLSNFLQSLRINKSR